MYATLARHNISYSPPDTVFPETMIGGELPPLTS